MARHPKRPHTLNYVSQLVEDFVEIHGDRKFSDDDAIGLSAAMWNHAPEMHELMAEHGVPWPKFEEGEMEDLVAFLKDSAQAASD